MPQKRTQNPKQESNKPKSESTPPICPYCSNEKETVVCEANRSEPMFTRYYCPNRKTTGCSFSAKVPKPAFRRRIRQSNSSPQDAGDEEVAAARD